MAQCFMLVRMSVTQNYEWNKYTKKMKKQHRYISSKHSSQISWLFMFLSMFKYFLNKIKEKMKKKTYGYVTTDVTIVYIAGSTWMFEYPEVLTKKSSCPTMDEK